jgi:hypothetical protein
MSSKSTLTDPFCTLDILCVYKEFSYLNLFLKKQLFITNDLSLKLNICFKLTNNDHITLKAPVLVRSPKLSNVEPG